jgi:Na+/H+-dicarboxylate symporter
MSRQLRDLRGNCMSEQNGTASLPEIKVPAVWTFAGLAAGLALGVLFQGKGMLAPLLALAEPVGTLWLRALQMTILPLVSALIFTGILRTVAAASAGAMARRTLGWFAAVLLAGAALSAVMMPLLLRSFPVPAQAVAALRGAEQTSAKLPGLGDYLATLIPANVFEAAARDAILPVIFFMTLFALATARLPEGQRAVLGGLFESIAAAMMVVIRWVLRLAPLGVFALALGVSAKSGTAMIAVLGHYIALVSTIGALVMLSGYALAIVVARQNPFAFAKAMLPVHAVAISTQSSLASLPAMLAACRKLGVSETSADFVLPLAVALFRATSPAMNLAVVAYVAQLTGVELSPVAYIAGIAVAMLAMLGSPSLPGTISFVTATGPIALAMGVPIGPLALLVAVEMLPDIMRTLGNVTLDVAVTTAVDRQAK